ncbi:MAG: hypothetical protein ACO2PK_14530 [Armatimonadota bacterium]
MAGMLEWLSATKDNGSDWRIGNGQATAMLEWLLATTRTATTKKQP